MSLKTYFTFLDSRKLMMALFCAFVYVPVIAQTYIPPVLKADSANFRKDIMTRAYISPQKVVWTKGNLQHT